MKRLIKYYNVYSSDSCNFSASSTEYEVLEYLFEDSADINDLKRVAEELNLSGQVQSVKKEKYIRELSITEAIKTDVIVRDEGEEYSVFLGFITVENGDNYSKIDYFESLDNEMPRNTFDVILNGQLFDINDVEELRGETTIMIENWNAFHHLRFLGYKKFDEMLKDLDIEDYVFNDEVFRCDSCGECDYMNNGYTNNYRMIDGNCVGVRCGCHIDATIERIDDYINNSDQAVDREVIKVLENDNKVKKIETFVRDEHPVDVLKELLKKDETKEYIFCHEESSQFQTYFTVYELLNE